MSLDLAITLFVAIAALAGIGFLVRLERRPRELGQSRLIPTTPLLFICLIVLVIAFAHLITLATGTPHTGRLRR